MTHATIIDGYSQPRSPPNTLAHGDNAVIEIQLSGGNDPTADGLQIAAAGSTVGAGSRVHQRHPPPGQQRRVIAGDLIGTDPTGTAAAQLQRRRASSTAAPATVGGTAPADRNIISGNFRRLRRPEPPAEKAPPARDPGQLHRHRLRPAPSASATALLRPRDGIDFVDRPSATRSAGPRPGAGNLISGNAADGIQLNDSGSNQALIQGNLIGTDVTGTAAAGQRRRRRVDRGSSNEFTVTDDPDASTTSSRPTAAGSALHGHVEHPGPGQLSSAPTSPGPGRWATPATASP